MPQINFFENYIDDFNNEEIVLQHEAVGKSQYDKLNMKQKDIVDQIINV